MITLSDILTRVHRRTGRMARVRNVADIATSTENDDILIDFVTDGLARIAQTNRLHGTITWETEDDVYDYVVPDGVRRVREIWIDGVKLDQRDGLAVQLEAKANTDGIATTWGYHGGRIYLNRTPTADGVEMLLHVTFSDGYPTGDSSDVLEHLPEEYREVLTDFVLAQWFMATAPDLYASHMTAFERGLDRGRFDPMTDKFTSRTSRRL